MITLHSGFDGLDVAIKANPPLELVEVLEASKALAADMHRDCPQQFNGISFSVSAGGGQGGYAYRVDTGTLGATWFFKKPRAGDPWGVRVSFKSRPLALFGLEKVRADFEKTCLKLGLRVPLDGISIGRVDYAIDILVASLKLEPTNFKVHSRANRRSHSDLEEMVTNGPSGRYTSVTIGKMPGRQVIVYDKRKEAQDHRKLEWPAIWKSALECQGLGEVDPMNPISGDVWRVELRLGKNALRARRDIRSWQSLYANLQEEMEQLAQEVSLRCPVDDTNRSRWPLHPFWGTMQNVLIDKGLFDIVPELPPEPIQVAELEGKKEEFLTLISSLSVTLAALEECAESEFPEFLEKFPSRITDFLHRHPRGLGQRFEDAREKYRHLR